MAVTSLLLLFGGLGCDSGHTSETPARLELATPPPLLSPSQQIAVREQWLQIRHGMLLEMMRRHEIDMWIVVNEEFHDDPLTAFVAPPRPYAGRRDYFIFVDRGDEADESLRKVAVTRYASEAVRRFFETPSDPRPDHEVIPELISQHTPDRIALSTGGGRGISASLGHDAYLHLAELLGDAGDRIVSAEPLLEEYLDTRLAEEQPYYETMVWWTEHLVRRAFSSEVITPDTTTVGDIRRWLYDRAGALGVSLWFEPDLRVQRRGMERESSRGFLAVASESTVIRRGDLIHVDFGFGHLGLATDYQRMAYVLGNGEDGPPSGLVEALRRTNQLQDALVRHSRPGRAAGDVYSKVMDDMEGANIAAQIYSHPLGNHGHGLGASIDFRSAHRADAEESTAKVLRQGSYIAIELNTSTPIAEWDGQEVFMMEEDPARLTDQGWQFFRPRQTELYLIP